jgi:hypothetical protein
MRGRRPAHPSTFAKKMANAVHGGSAGPDKDVVFFTCKDASHSLHGIKAMRGMTPGMTAVFHLLDPQRFISARLREAGRKLREENKL